MNKKIILITLAFVLVTALTAFVSSSATALLYKTGNANQVTVSRTEYEALQKYKRLEEVASVIRSEFVEEVDEQTLLDGAAKGMVASLGDIYALYYTPEERAALNQRSEGKYAGVGLQLTVDPDVNLITVARVFKNAPAEKAGILPGDRIVRVFETDVLGSDLDKAVKLMKGEPGTPAHITIMRGSDVREIDIMRAEITINRVEHRMVTKDIGLLAIYEFMGDDVRGFQEAIAALKAEGAKGLIIDVRNNPGGYVTDVVGIADQLLPKGIIVYSEDRFGHREEELSDDKMLGMPLAVLVNKYSASASEILAGSVQDYGVGTIIGTQTWGKGVMQTVHTFRTDGAGMQLTTAHYYTPKGRDINKIGLTPDIVVDLPENVVKNPTLLTDENDAQLQQAIKTVAAEIR